MQVHIMGSAEFCPREAQAQPGTGKAATATGRRSVETDKCLGWCCQESQPHLTVMSHSSFPDDVPAGTAGVPHGEVRSRPGSLYLCTELEVVLTCHAEAFALVTHLCCQKHC